MSNEYYFKCETCESSYELICTKISYEYSPEYCPFCGSIIDDEEELAEDE